MMAYVAYVACILALIGLSYGLGYGSGRHNRTKANLALIRRDACGRCVYLTREIDMAGGDMKAVSASMDSRYCENCAVKNEINQGGNEE